MASKKVNLDIAQTLNITCRRGDTFELSLTLKDDAGASLNMLSNNYKFMMQVRSDDANDGAFDLVLSTLYGRPTDASANTSIIEAMETTDATASTGTNLTQDVVTIKVPAPVMRGVPAGRYLYDLQYTSGDDDSFHRTLLKGSFVVNEDVAHYVEDTSQQRTKKKAPTKTLE